MRSGWPRLELRMCLRGDEVRMNLAWQLDELNQLGVRGGAADHQTRLLEVRAVSIIHLIAMAMPLLNMGLSITLGDHRARQQLRRIGTEPHRSTKITIAGNDRYLFGHRRDHRMRRVRSELATVCPFQARHVACDFDHHALQT